MQEFFLNMFQAVIPSIAVIMVFSWALIWVFFLLRSFIYYILQYWQEGNHIVGDIKYTYCIDDQWQNDSRIQKQI